MLREVKYLLLLDIKVPERASALFEKVNVYRTQSGNLQLIVDMYNDILSTLLPVEKPLMMSRIVSMDKSLEKGITELRWNSQGIDPFIKNAMLVVSEIDELVKKMKENVRKMQDFMELWKRPLFERKAKPMLPEDVEQTHTASVMPRLEDIRNHGKEIHRLMKDSADNIKPNKKDITWLNYVDYVNGLIIEGMTIGIDNSLCYLKKTISIAEIQKEGSAPIFDLSLIHI